VASPVGNFLATFLVAYLSKNRGFVSDLKMVYNTYYRPKKIQIQCR